MTRDEIEKLKSEFNLERAILNIFNLCYWALYLSGEQEKTQ